ncbi:MAG: methyltransferase domain-containing protein [Chloroflexi bacterium]|nr:methyltransferase domain-containing protein [Chloroflexota bacterium]
MVVVRQINEEKRDLFAQRVVNDISATAVTTMSIIGDRLGLFKDLASHGPATSEELADRTGIKERYAREWLGSLACAGYLEYDPVTQRFTLPPEHAPCLAEERGPFFVGGFVEVFPSWWEHLDALVHAFKNGGGIPQRAYNDHMWSGLERFTASWFENLLVQVWIPAVPEVQTRLQKGAVMADVGCGNGRALIKLAQTFPESRFVGYDIFGPAIENARANATLAGVAERIRFEQLDVSRGMPEKFDVIATWDVVHDMANPRGALKAIRQALKRDGIYLLLDINCSDKLQENIGPLGAMFYGVSVLYCLTTAMADGGEGLGTVGLPPARVRELSAQAGFSKVNQLPLENPFNILYEIRP